MVLTYARPQSIYASAVLHISDVSSAAAGTAAAATIVVSAKRKAGRRRISHSLARPLRKSRLIRLRVPRAALGALAGTNDGRQQSGLVQLFAEEHGPEDEKARLLQQDAAREGERRQGDDRAADAVNDVERSCVAQAAADPAHAVPGRDPADQEQQRGHDLVPRHT